MGQIRVRVGQGLVLADKAAQLADEIPEMLLLLGSLERKGFEGVIGLYGARSGLGMQCLRGEGQQRQQ